MRQDVFIKRAQELDALGFFESLQRLLRMKIFCNETIIDLCKDDPEHQLGLKELLNEATKRDGQVLYEFGDPDIPSNREGEVQKAETEAYVLDPLSNLLSLFPKKVGEEYRDWITKRNEEIDAQYNEMKQAVEEEHRNALTNSNVQLNRI